jgi:predicted nucleic acid-binding protein
MSDLVVDASIALAWGLPDESSPYAVSALAAIEEGIVHVPDLWAYEVANGLVIAVRRQRLTQADMETFTVAISRMRLCVWRLDAMTVIRDGAVSAIRLGLTAYDGAYVDLALQTGAPLATLDERMRKAAVAAGATVFGSYGKLKITLVV